MGIHSLVRVWAVLALSALACRAPAPDIRIGVPVGETGAQVLSSSQAVSQSARLAEQLINASGGITIGGTSHKVRVIFSEIRETADIATSQARDLLNRDSVVVLIGPQFSLDAIPVALLAEQARVPMITPMATHPSVTAGKSYVFRIAYTDDLQGKGLARFAMETLHAKRAALIYDVALEYSRNLAGVFQAEFTARGGTVVAEQTFTSDAAADFIPQLTRIRAANPDVIFAPDYTAVDSLLVIQARRLGIRATFVGSDSWDIASLEAVPGINGSYAAVQWHPSIATIETDSFIARYRRAYGTTPNVTAASTWDAFQVVFAAIRSAGSMEPDSIRHAIAATDGFRGVTGMLSYRTGGDPSKSVYIMKFVNGLAVFQQRVDP